MRGFIIASQTIFIVEGIDVYSVVRAISNINTVTRVMKNQVIYNHVAATGVVLQLKPQIKFKYFIVIPNYT